MTSAPKPSEKPLGEFPSAAERPISGDVMTYRFKNYGLLPVVERPASTPALIYPRFMRVDSGWLLFPKNNGPFYHASIMYNTKPYGFSLRIGNWQWKFGSAVK